MSKEVEKLINDLLNSNGRLDCGSAFKISAKTNTPIEEVGKIASNIGVKIDNCELGQFGKLDCSRGSIEIRKVSAWTYGQRARQWFFPFCRSPLCRCDIFDAFYVLPSPATS